MNNFIRGDADRYMAQIWRKEANTNRLEKFDLSLSSQYGGGLRG